MNSLWLLVWNSNFSQVTQLHHYIELCFCAVVLSGFSKQKTNFARFTRFSMDDFSLFFLWIITIIIFYFSIVLADNNMFANMPSMYEIIKQFSFYCVALRNIELQCIKLKNKWSHLSYQLTFTSIFRNIRHYLEHHNHTLLLQNQYFLHWRTFLYRIASSLIMKNASHAKCRLILWLVWRIYDLSRSKWKVR